MQILLFISTLLLILSLATAARFDQFLLFSGLRSTYEHYMQEDFFSYYNAEQRDRYTNAKPSKKNAKHPGKTPPPQPPKDRAKSVKVKGIGQINLYPFFSKNPSSKPEDLEYAANMKTLLIRLIEKIYAKVEPFIKPFKTMSVENFVEQMIEAGREPICGKDISRLSDISSISFQDKEMRKLFYWMLKGGKNGKPYPSLLNFLTWSKASLPINIYSADDELIEAIYLHDPQSAERIILERQKLHEKSELAGEDSYKEELQLAVESWGALFSQQVSTGFPESFLDFSLPSKDEEPGQ